jgi:hypothetical protein
MMMKRTIFTFVTTFVVFVAVLGVLVLRPVPKVKATTGCSNKTLSGSYGLVASGSWHVAGPVPANYSVLVKFDGKGGFTGSKLNIVADGSPEAGNPYSFTGGKYTVNSDCTLTFTTPHLAAFDATITSYGIAIDTGGDELAGNVVSSNSNITGTFDAKKVAVGQLVFLP